MKKNIMQQLLLAMLVVLVGTLSFTSCSDSNDEPQTPPKEEDIPKRGKPDGYDALAFLQSAIVWEDSVGKLVRNYGEPLPGLDPNEEHLFIGVETLEEARAMFDLWLTPDAKVTTQTPTTTDVTVELTDTLGKSQGELFFKAVTDGSAIAEVTTTAAVKHFSKITFIPKSAWPSNAKHNGLYVKGDIVEMEYFHSTLSWKQSHERVIKKQNFVCIRAQSEGVQPFFLGISAECPKVYWYGDFEYIWEGSDLISQQSAQEASKILKADWNLFVSAFRQAGAGELVAGDYYWYNEFHNKVAWRELFGIDLSSGELDWFDVQNCDYEKHALYGIFTDLYIKKDPIDYVERHWDSEKNCVVSDTLTIKEYYTIRGDRKDDWFSIGNGETYVIKENVSCKCLHIMGNGKLIICDGAELKVEHIKVNPNYQATLNIYSGPRDAGRLIADASDWDGAPGIGDTPNHNVIIHGGYIEAYGGKNAAGIGGGKNGIGGLVHIYGGTVKAYAGADGAGIGGGETGSGNQVVIYGGLVFAYGNHKSDGFGAGIGGGQDGNSGTIIIRGGEVHAYGGDDAAGIGTGEQKTGSIKADNITISGGAVEAVGGGEGAGIGAGQDAEVGTITITTESGSVYVSGRAGNGCGWWAGAIGAYDEEDRGTLNIGKGVKLLSIETDYSWSTIPVALNPVAFAQQRCHVQLRTCDHPGQTAATCIFCKH